MAIINYKDILTFDTDTNKILITNIKNRGTAEEILYKMNSILRERNYITLEEVMYFVENKICNPGPQFTNEITYSHKKPKTFENSVCNNIIFYDLHTAKVNFCKDHYEIEWTLNKVKYDYSIDI